MLIVYRIVLANPCILPLMAGETARSSKIIQNLWAILFEKELENFRIYWPTIKKTSELYETQMCCQTATAFLFRTHFKGFKIDVHEPYYLYSNVIDLRKLNYKQNVIFCSSSVYGSRLPNKWLSWKAIFQKGRRAYRIRRTKWYSIPLRPWWCLFRISGGEYRRSGKMNVSKNLGLEKICCILWSMLIGLTSVNIFGI